MKTYELLLIFSSSMKEDAVEKTLDRVRGEITKLNGAIRKTEALGNRTFARMMNKQDSGNYVRISMELDPENMGALQARFKLNEDISRYQIVVAEKRPATTAKAAAISTVEQPAGR